MLERRIQRHHSRLSWLNDQIPILEREIRDYESLVEEISKGAVDLGSVHELSRTAQRKEVIEENRSLLIKYKKERQKLLLKLDRVQTV